MNLNNKKGWKQTEIVVTMSTEERKSSREIREEENRVRLERKRKKNW